MDKIIRHTKIFAIKVILIYIFLMRHIRCYFNNLLLLLFFVLCNAPFVVYYTSIKTLGVSETFIMSIHVTIMSILAPLILNGFITTHKRIVDSKIIFLSLKSIIDSNKKISQLIMQRDVDTQNDKMNIKDDIFWKIDILLSIDSLNHYEKSLLINLKSTFNSNYINFTNTLYELKNNTVFINVNNKYLKCQILDFFTNEKNVNYRFIKKIKAINTKSIEREIEYYNTLLSINDKLEIKTEDLLLFREDGDFSKKVTDLLVKKMKVV